MQHVGSRHLVWGLALVVAGCGGGGGGGDSGGGGTPAYTLSGTISIIADSLVDSDVNDPRAPRVVNDDPGQQQAIRNPVTLGGYANEAGTGEAGPSFSSGDVFDGFTVPLTSGQNVNLFVADPAAGDLDLFLLDANLDLVDSSEGTGRDETVTAPSAGNYTVLVYAFSGASNYILQVGADAAAANHSLRYGADFVPGEMIVRFTDAIAAGSAGPALESRVQALGLSLDAVAPGRSALLSLPTPGLPAALAAAAPVPAGWMPYLRADGAKRQTVLALKALARKAEVQFAEPNLMRHALAVPNDPYFPDQWHYTLMNLPTAWDTTTGATSVLVAVIDTGVVLSHPDLAGQFDPQDPNGYDFISSPSTARDGGGRDQNADDPGDGQFGSSSFHGTHVAGTVAAATNNGLGVAGVAWNARIMPLRVLGQGGGSSFDIQQSVLYAAGLPNASGVVPAKRADVINLSLGGGGFSSSEQQTYTDAAGAGVLIAAAAGNDGNGTLSYPASYANVISVASVSRSKQRAPYSQFNSAVDVAAPGGNQATGSNDGVLSTHASDSSGSVRPNLFYLQGTSMATPHVAGVMALMKTIYPTLTHSEFFTLLTNGSITEDLGAAGRDNSFGYGLLDARKAVAAATTLANGTAPVASANLSSSTTMLQFGPSLTSLAFDLSNSGSAALTVTGVTDDQPWLSVAAEAVNGDGTGRYRATVDRTGLAPGLYQGTITATSTANSVQIPVTMQVGGGGGAVSAGHIYALLIDADTFDSVAEFEADPSSGSYAYAFDDVPPGDYVIVAGSDQDNDNFICDSGESCGSYPTLDSLEVITVTGDRSGLDFLAGFRFGVNTAAASSGAAAPQGGFRRLR